MKKIFLAACVFSVGVSLFGSESIVISEKSDELSDKLIFKVALNGKLNDQENSRRSILCSLQDTVKLAKFFNEGIGIYGMPFVGVTLEKDERVKQVKCTQHESCYLSEKQIQNMCNHVQTVATHIPVKYCFNNIADKYTLPQYKCKAFNDELKTVEISGLRDSDHACECLLKFNVDPEEANAMNDNANELFKYPVWYETYESELVTFGVLAENLREELNYKGGVGDWIEEKDGTIDYLREDKEKMIEEYEKLEKKIEDLQKKTAAANYSQFKKYGVAGLVSMIMLYILYIKSDIIKDYILVK